MVGELCDRLNLGSTAYYPFAYEQLAWIIREHMFAIKRKSQLTKATLLNVRFFKNTGQSLLHTMLADQLASIPAETTNNTLPILTLLERLRKLAPDGMLPPVDFGDDARVDGY